MQCHPTHSIPVVGLTGGIASGKSTVAAMLAEAGAAIVDADRIAHEVVRRDRPAWQEVVRRFGEGILRPDGEIDRGRLGSLVFADPEARRDLERIVHPRVFQEMLAAVERLGREATARLIVCDIPLLFESGLQRWFPAVILVAVPEPLQMERLMARDGLTLEDARARVQAQMPIERKRTLASHIVDNSGPLEATRRQVERLLVRLSGPSGA
jgi:dephospho-CoA kinase